MRKLFSFALLVVLFTSLLILNGCNKDESNPIVTPPTSGSNTVTYTSTNGGTLSFDNVSITVLPSTVPIQSNGSAGSVIFSIETSATLESGIPALPSGFTLVGKYVKIGPDGFVFRYPVNCVFPAGSESSASGLGIARYYPDLSTWKIVPLSSVDSINKKLGINTLSLGYFAVVRFAPAGDASIDSDGGMQYGSGLPDWYTITIASATLKYPLQASWYAGGSPVGTTYGSGSDPTGMFSINPCRAIVAQGNYTVWISKTTRDGYTFTTQTYSLPASVAINNPLTWWGWGNSTGYVDIILPGGGTWVPGYPTNWPPPTTTYGSGLYQSTLTWVNTTGAVVDLDMHLYGPNNMHVWYGGKVFGDSIFVLDRDWTSPLGNAVENIYNRRGTMPSGTYQVKVKYYSGTGTKPFNCRVLLNGSVIASYSGSLSTGEVLIKEFTL